MSYREKVAWISFGVMLVVFGGFYGGMVAGLVPSHGFRSLTGLIAAVVAAIVLQIVLTAFAAAASRDDAGSPKDERERLIELKATQVAYYVFVFAVLAATFVAVHSPQLGLPHFSLPQTALTVVAAIVVADLAKSAAQIVFYRRGA